jgi:hypothetical protein
MRVNDYYKTEGKWLKAADLGDKKHRVVIIGLEEVDFKQDGKKMAVRFENKAKGLVLNVTNAKSIAAQHGDDMDTWIGKEITIFPTTTEFNGEDKPCIRIEQDVPEATQDDDIPW